MFVESLALGNSPSFIEKKVREVIENDDWTLRHPAGPDALAFLARRAGMTDEGLVNYGAQSDEEWLEQVGREFGMTPKLL